MRQEVEIEGEISSIKEQGPAEEAEPVAEKQRNKEDAEENFLMDGTADAKASKPLRAKI